MTRKLDEADRAAVDLLFDRLNTASDGGRGGFVAVSGAVSEDRVGALQQMLSVLSQMPAPEPPADLATRTLQRVARKGAAPATMRPAPQPFIDPTQPMA